MAFIQNPGLLKVSSVRDTDFVIVDCGAREGLGEASLLAAFPQARLIGFEPDAAECERLNRGRSGDRDARRSVFYPVAVGARQESRRFYSTENPACSSLYRPDGAFFGQFLDCASQVRITDEAMVETVPLDSYLPTVGVEQIHFLKLDVQGAELDVLQGARGFLASGVLGLKVEVSFAPIYERQPLFADVDAYLRQFGFVLFDLSRTRYRREAAPADLPTRGQLLWGDAVYLRDHERLLEGSSAVPCLQLAVLASACGFHDYALKVVDALVSTPALPDSQRRELRQERDRYAEALLRPNKAQRLHRVLTRFQPVRALTLRALRFAGRLIDVQQEAAERHQFSWSD